LGNIVQVYRGIFIKIVGEYLSGRYALCKGIPTDQVCRENIYQEYRGIFILYIGECSSGTYIGEYLIFARYIYVSHKIKIKYPKLFESAIHLHFYVSVAFIHILRAQKHFDILKNPLKMADYATVHTVHIHMVLWRLYLYGNPREMIQEIREFLSHTGWV